MDYLPIFYSLKKRKVLLVGAGEIALRRLSTLLEFTTDVTIIAPKVDEKIDRLVQKYRLICVKKEYESFDCKGFDMVIVAANSLTLQKQISEELDDRRVLFNCVDIPELNSFIFPSIIKEPNLTIAISTNASAPAFTKKLKEYIKKSLPKNMDSFLEELKDYRGSHPKGESRMEYLKQKVDKFFKKL